MRISSVGARLVVASFVAGSVALPTTTSAATSTPTAPSAPACTIEKLESPDWAEGASVTASDNTGSWLAGVLYATGRSAIATWHNGKYQGAYDKQLWDVTGINRGGAVVGTYWLDDKPAGFALVDGTFTTLAVPPRMKTVWVTGISRTGLISGYAESATHQRQRPFTWKLTDLTHPRAMRLDRGLAYTVGTSPDGHTAVLMPHMGKQPQRSFVFDKRSEPVELPGTAAGYVVEVDAIADGWAAGKEYNEATDTTHHLRWDLATLTPEITDDEMSFITSVNDHGTLGGESANDLGELYSDRRIELPPLDGEDSALVNVVTTSGDAAGEAQDGSRWAAVRWNCS